MLGAGRAEIECVCTFPPLVGLNPCQPGDGCTAEPVYLITTIINWAVGGSRVGGPNTVPAPAFIRFLCGIVCEHKPCGQGKPQPGPAIVARGTWWARDKLFARGWGENCRAWVTQALDLPCLWEWMQGFPTLSSSFAFPFCRRRKGTVVELAPTPLLHCLPLLLLWKRSLMGLSPRFISASLQFLSLTHMPRIFSGDLPSTDLLWCTNTCRSQGGSYFPRQMSPSVKKIISCKLGCSYSSCRANCSGKKGMWLSPGSLWSCFLRGYWTRFNAPLRHPTGDLGT